MCILTPQTGTASERAVLAIAGSVESDSLPEIARFIRNGRKTRNQVVLDLSDVTLLDRAAAQFFARQQQQGVELMNCPSYLEPWIFREANH
jgi:ABC-type transporter Mla MlaB component